MRVQLLGIMRTPEELQRGLSGRDWIPDDSAMVFVHTPPRRVHYHMENTRIPLQIAFLDLDMRIDKICEMENEFARSCSDTFCPMAIEMPLGAFDRLGIRVGQGVVIDHARNQVVFTEVEAPECV